MHDNEHIVFEFKFPSSFTEEVIARLKHALETGQVECGAGFAVIAEPPCQFKHVRLLMQVTKEDDNGGE